MTQINLLPWREAQREEQKKQFLIEIGISAAITLAIVFVIHMALQGRMSYRQSKVTFLQTGIQQQTTQLDTLKENKEEVIKLYDQLLFLTDLKQSNFDQINFYNKLIQLTPENVILLKLVTDNRQFVVDGLAKSNLEITQFSKNLSAIEEFKDTELNQILVKQQGNAKVKYFQLIIRRLELKDES